MTRIRRTAAAALFAAVVALTAAHTQPPPPAAKPPGGNVRDHGAKGDGQTDDWQAIQNAVDAAPGIVHFPRVGFARTDRGDERAGLREGAVEKRRGAAREAFVDHQTHGVGADVDDGDRRAGIQTPLRGQRLHARAAYPHQGVFRRHEKRIHDHQRTDNEQPPHSMRCTVHTCLSC